MTALALILVSLMTFRITLLLNEEEGPFDVLAKIRAMAGRWTMTTKLFACYWCLSIWVGLGTSALWIWANHQGITDWLILGIGASGASIVLRSLVSALESISDYVDACLGPRE